MINKKHPALMGAAVVAMALTAACGNPGASTDCSTDPLSESELVAASERDTADEWRLRIDSLVANAPPDSIVHAVVIYTSSPIDADRQVLSQANATIDYEFVAIAAVSVLVPVEGLEVIASSTRVSYMEVPSENLIPGC